MIRIRLYVRYQSHVLWLFRFIGTRSTYFDIPEEQRPIIERINDLLREIDAPVEIQFEIKEVR